MSNNNRISIDELKADKSSTQSQNLPKGVFSASTPISIDELAKNMPQKPQVSETWEEKQWNDLDNAIDRFKREMDEFRQQVEEQEMYEKDLDDEMEDTSVSSTASIIDDLEYDDEEEMDTSYIQKQKMEDSPMNPINEYSEAKVQQPAEMPAQPEIPRMKSKSVETVEPVDFSKIEEAKQEAVTIVKEKESVNFSNITTEETTIFMSDDEFDDEDTDSLDEVTSESERKERVAHVRSVVKQAFDNSMDAIDLSKFTISKKAVSVSNALASTGAKINVADWVLHSSGKCITVSQLSGPEIEALDVSGSASGMYNAYLNMFKVLYKHVENPNKGSLEQWLKTISFYDMQDLYFAFYRACFGRDNQILYSCEKCKETYMTRKPIEEMVSFKNDEIKAKCQEIINRGTATVEDTYEPQLIQITNDYVVAIRVPSMYDATLAPALLPDDWRQKYADLIGTCTFIDAIYKIDRATSSLDVVSTNPDPRDDVKTMKNRIKAFNKIFSTFSSREYAKMKGVISNLGNNIDDIEYFIPADTCKKCGAEIPKQAMDPLQMLFTYHQLGQAAYISEN